MQTLSIISLVLAGVSILVSTSTFVYANIRREKLQFWNPEFYLLTRIASDNVESVNTILVCSVNVTNTGSVVHTVNYLWGRLKNVNGVTHDFRMQTAPEEIQIVETKKAPLATGFSVAPNNNIVKLIGFVSDDPNLQLAPGEYTFALYAWIDGKAPTSQQISLNIVLDAAHINLINKGNGFVKFQYELDASLLND